MRLLYGYTFRERKAHRKEYLFRFVYGWRFRACVACSGSGLYDSDGSPPCGGCGGTGKERYPGIKAKRFQEVYSK